MKFKQLAFAGIIIFSIWFLYIERTILTPFILALVFAYVFHPLINFFSNKLKLPRILGIIFLYLLILGFFITIGIIASHRLSDESTDLTKSIASVLDSAKNQINTLPDWMQDFAKSLLSEFRKSRFISMIESPAVVPFFSVAISRVVAFFIFLFSGFYFLKDGEKFIDNLLTIVPQKHKIDVEILLRKINKTLGNYLRGQLLLIIIMSLMTYISLLVLGIRFALTIGIFTGFAEIVPIFGPITAASVAVAVVFITGTANFGLNPLNASVIVIAIYFILRHIEDYLIIPHVMHQVTKLPPFIIFFAVIAGGHIAGILGLILAVPIVAILRIVTIFALDKLNSEKS